MGTIDPMLPAPWRVRRARRDTRYTFTLDLEPVNVVDGLQFLPGQFNMLYVFGAGEVPISMSGDPAKSGVTTHTVRAVGAVTKAMGRLKRGDAIGLRGPFGASWPVEEAAGKDVVIVPTAGVGYGCTEAPRGLLYHRYRIDEQGLITDAKIVTPTSQNQKRIEADLRQFAPRYLDLPKEQLTRRCEQAVRNYDPCISCATHFLRLEIERE
jgi:Nickel-dependent hydrogenase